MAKGGLMLHVLVDTCVWLDFDQDHKQSPLFDLFEEMLDADQFALLLPRLVVDEFNRNRDRIAKASEAGLSTQINIVKEAIARTIPEGPELDAALELLNDVNFRIPQLGGFAVGILGRIEDIFKETPIIETNSGVKAAGADRALARKAPMHQGKNAIADAMIIETYFECLRANDAPGDAYVFLTHNKKDFSSATNFKLPHEDFAVAFNASHSLYFVALKDFLTRVDPDRETFGLWERDWREEPRRLTTIYEAIERLTNQVWYNRHMNRVHAIEHGTVEIVNRIRWDAERLTTQNYVLDEIWEGALRSAKRVRRELGKGNFGPWNDFEWGMINGKLSALRWMLGDEWDMLDT
jgi:hypothetical protein